MGAYRLFVIFFYLVRTSEPLVSPSLNVLSISTTSKPLSEYHTLIMFLFTAVNTESGVTVSRLLDYGIHTAETTTFSAAFPVVYADAQAL